MNISFILKICTKKQPTLISEKKCGGVKIFDVDEINDMKQRLIRGHNGLRDRIAGRLIVANMVELVGIFNWTIIELFKKLYHI